MVHLIKDITQTNFLILFTFYFFFIANNFFAHGSA